MYTRTSISLGFSSRAFSYAACAFNNQGVIAGYHGADVNKGFTYVLKTKTFNNENYPNSARRRR
ncbi:MAG TPA: hypothetical protein VFE61_26910 [Candidatus Sulfotelmatobacter sp.]|nr:hypothetical protein [Candidatus Sulfotelmatobacter sp.]